MTVEFPEQIPGAHVVPASYRSQPPAPLQSPVCPHEAMPWSTHAPCGSRTPKSTGTHVPTAPATAQDTQPPVQVVLQQTSSIQNPLAQPAADVQPMPIGASLGTASDCPSRSARASPRMAWPSVVDTSTAASRLGGPEILPPASGDEGVSDSPRQPAAAMTNNKIPPRTVFRIMDLPTPIRTDCI